MPATRRTLVCAAALTALLGSAAPALAQPSDRDAPMIVTTPLTTGPHGERAGQTSSNWAGYSATGRQFTSVSAHWVQPTSSCTTTDTWSSFWVGLDGDGSNTVEQTGTEADCSGGSPSYAAWYEMYPAYPVRFANPVSPGDHLSASVTAGRSGSFTLVLTDATRGWSQTVRKTLRSAKLASAEVIAEAPSSLSGPLPLTDFGAVGFGSAMANGQALGGFAPTQITMAERSGVTKATTSTLSSGTDFSVTWQHN
jgi:hypothetical protein